MGVVVIDKMSNADVRGKTGHPILEQTTPHGRECTRPLHVLAAPCPLQTSPVTQPCIHDIHAMIPH